MFCSCGCRCLATVILQSCLNNLKNRFRLLFVSLTSTNFVGMKHIIATLTMFFILTVNANAQTENNTKGVQLPIEGIDADTIAALRADYTCSASPYVRTSYSDADERRNDTLNLPRLTSHGTVPLMYYPYQPFGFLDSWSLHKGLNVNLGASVFAAFGKGAPSGAGFAQDVSLMYALPLSKRLTLALGGWVEHLTWSGEQFTEGGLNAVLGYKFNERLEATAFVKKSLVDNRMPLRYAAMGDVGDRIGASLKYNFSPSFSMQITVQATRFNCPAPGFHPLEAEENNSFGGFR